MDKKLTYRLVDGEEDYGSALLVASNGDVGSTTEMEIVQARNGLPKLIQKDRVVYDRSENAFYVGQGDGTPKRVADIRVYARMQDFPAIGEEHRLYICLREKVLAVWTEGEWRYFSTSPVSLTNYNGVSTYDEREDFPKVGQEGQIYLTKDGYGYSYVNGTGYQAIFGGRNMSYTRTESDARYAMKSDIVAQKTLEELGGITPHDVDAKVQAAVDDADAKFVRTDEYDNAIASKADKGESYTKAESDAAYAKKADIPTLSSLGAITSEQVSTTYATKKRVEAISDDLDAVKAKTNTLSSYAKTEEVKDIVKSTMSDLNPDFGIYAVKSDVDAELAKKVDAATAATKDDLKPYALKSELPTAESLDVLTKTSAEVTYAKIDDTAAARKAADDVAATLSKEHYTKAEVDKKFEDKDAGNKKSYAPIGALASYVKKADADSAYAAKSSLDLKADKADFYTKAEVDKKIDTVQTKGVDLTGYLHEKDTESDEYIKSIVKANTPSEDTIAKKDGLLAEVIRQDRAKDEDDLTLDYFVNKSDVSGLTRRTKETCSVEDGTDGKQHIKLTGKPASVDSVVLYINGVLCTSGYSCDATLSELVWDGGYELSGSDIIIAEYDTVVVPQKVAPKAEESSTDDSARKVSINAEDLETIRDCTSRSEQAQAAAESSASSSLTAKEDAQKSAESARSDAQSAASAKAAIDTQKADIDKDVEYLKNEAIAKDVEITLFASKWNGTRYTVEDARIKEKSVILIDVAKNASEDEELAFEDALIDGFAQMDGSIILDAEETPVLDIPVSMTII